MTDPLAAIHRRQRRDIRLLYTTLGDAIENALVRQHEGRDPDEPVTHADRQAIMDEVDAALDVIWGKYPEDPDSAVRQVLLRDAQAARFAPLDAAVKAWRKAMPDDLRQRIEEDAREVG